MTLYHGHWKKTESEHLSREQMTKQGVRKVGSPEKSRTIHAEREIDKKTWDRKSSSPH
ncbi:MAG TPA: hypothetical protein VGE26_05165 [Sphingobacteriaceae bacterium]